VIRILLLAAAIFPIRDRTSWMAALSPTIPQFSSTDGMPSPGYPACLVLSGSGKRFEKFSCGIWILDVFVNSARSAAIARSSELPEVSTNSAMPEPTAGSIVPGSMLSARTIEGPGSPGLALQLRQKWVWLVEPTTCIPCARAVRDSVRDRRDILENTTDGWPIGVITMHLTSGRLVLNIPMMISRIFPFRLALFNVIRIRTWSNVIRVALSP